ncbi:MAG: ABC transporter ATP-binding protein, partial [Planctomycetes bacterium]|nr:ABC transporter ATP-binding protein [Planctomycetota bacterium]
MNRVKKIREFTKGAPVEIRFWSSIHAYVKPFRRVLLLSTLCSMVVGVAVAIQPLLIKWIIDDGILGKGGDGQLLPPDERIHKALLFVGAYLCLSVGRIFIWLVGYRQMISAIEGFLFGLRSRFFRHVQELCFRFHDTVSSGELFNYIMGSPMQSLKTFLQMGAMNLPFQIVSGCVALGTLASFNLVMTAISLTIIVIIVMLNRRSHFVMRELSSQFMKTESAASRYIADILQGSRAVKIYAMEESVTSSFERQIDCIREQGENLAKRQQLEFLKPELVQYLGIAAIYASGAWLCVRGELEVVAFVAFVTSINILMGPIMSLMQLNLVRGNAEAGLTRIEQILHMEKSTPEKIPSERIHILGQEQVARDKHGSCVEFCGVRFAYDESRPVFDGLNCSIAAGQSVALVGPSGSGKTTFASLLLRLYEVDGGRILLNGVDLRSYGLSELRQAFGVVPQNPFLFQGTLRDNIRVVRPDAGDEEVRRAASIAHIDDFIQSLPSGYDTWVGEGGFNLSGGQKQRISVARAVLTRASYFIFDEATSALDNESERRIQEAMAGLMKNHTTLIIAHRLSTVRHVDRVLVFEQGRIVQDGTYEELASIPGIFR